MSLNSVFSSLPLEYLSDSTSISSSSTGGGAIDPSIASHFSPRFGLNSYTYIQLGIQISIYFLVSLIFYFLPLRLLTKLAARIYGFEPTEALYRNRHDAIGGTRLREEEEKELLESSRSKQKRQDDSELKHLLHAESGKSEEGLRAHLLASPTEEVLDPKAPARQQMNDDDEPNKESQNATNDSLIDVYVHTRPNSLWLMNRQVDFDEAKFQELEMEASKQPWKIKCCIYGFNSFFAGQCFARGCLSSRPRNRSYRIRVYLRQLLIWTTYISISLLASQQMLQSSRFYYNPKVDFTCPDPIMNTGAGDWDCFSYDFSSNEGYWFTNSFYIDCDLPFNDTRAGIQAMSCYRFVTPTAESLLGSVSTIAALFTLVLGGMCTLLGWSLSLIKTRKGTNRMYAIPVLIGFLYFLLLAMNLLHTAIAINTPLVAIVLSAVMIKVRKAVGFDGEDTEIMPHVQGRLERALDGIKNVFREESHPNETRSEAVDSNSEQVQLQVRNGEDEVQTDERQSALL